MDEPTQPQSPAYGMLLNVTTGLQAVLSIADEDGIHDDVRAALRRVTSARTKIEAAAIDG